LRDVTTRFNPWKRRAVQLKWTEIRPGPLGAFSKKFSAARHFCNSAMKISMIKRRWWAALAVAVFGAAALPLSALPLSPASAAEINDYPTSARADYVFACMKANGETHQALERCSCSIDVIASLVPYERYVDAETVMSMIQTPGNLGNMFRATEFSKKVVDELRRAQAEAEIRCF
jgi:hypothetical protein